MNETITTMPLLPLRGLVLYPDMILHFDLGREPSIHAAEYAMGNNVPVFLVAQRDIKDENPDMEALYTIGPVAHVRQILRLPGNDVRILVEGECRARLVSIVETEPYKKAEVELLETVPAPIGNARTEALYRRLQEAFEEYSSLAPRMTPEVVMNVMSAEDLGYLSDYIAQSIQLRYQVKQRVLELIDPMRRTMEVISLLGEEIDILSIGQRIAQKVKTQMEKNQRDYFLREQLRAIEEELGEYDEDEEDDKYRERILDLHLEKSSEEHLLKEAKRLTHMQPSSPESNVIHTYLDTVLELPWNKRDHERTDLKAARRILDRDHYGMEKVKERILEFMAVRKLNPELKGQIICLIGPPGVGKTSVGVSIAAALGRKYARLSLGGVRDEADIRGHRKTYIGAMPGRIMSALARAGSSNALLLLDEVDKLGSDYRGDPSAALLEVLDPEQNRAFRDHYIEVPFDLSDVLFIVTANTADTIPRPLLDRMEVIEMPGYTDEEKLHIAKGHLFPRQLERHGLKKTQLRIQDAAFSAIAALYTRESGVRQLEREIAKICRHTAKLVADDPDRKRTTVTPANLQDYLGAPVFQPDYVNQADECGVVNGLAWTSVGGEMLQVEVNVVEGSGKVELTGNLGDVMKESAHAGLSYIRSRAKMLGIDPEFYKKTDVHIHFPEGAIPKDGPSAGITITTALVSALTGRPVRHDVAMTGEVTLRGRVLPIGGLREKTMAAFRAGMHTVIIPEANRKDLEDVVPAVREGLHFVTASHMDRVLETALVLPCAAAETASAAETPLPTPIDPLSEPSAVHTYTDTMRH